MAETDTDPQPIPGGDEHPFASIIAAYQADHAPAAAATATATAATTAVAPDAAVTHAPEPAAAPAAGGAPDFAHPPTAPVEPPAPPLQRGQTAAESVIAAFHAAGLASVADEPASAADATADTAAATPFLAAGPTAPADTTALPATAAVTAAPPAGGSTAPSTARRIAQIAPIGLLAVLTAVAAVVVHGVATDHDTTQPTGAAGGQTTAPPISFSPLPGSKTSTPTTSTPTAYTRALKQIKHADTGAGVTSAVAAALPKIHAVKAHPALAGAERTYLRSVGALAAIAAVDVPGAIDTARGAARAVGAAGAPTPTGTTDHVVSLAGTTALAYVEARIDTLAGEMAGATATAGLRSVAASAAPTAQFASELVDRLSGAERQRATTGHAALAALESMSVIDGDHLSLWSSIAPTLQSTLAAAGVSSATTDVADATAMIDHAKATLAAWAAQQGTTADKSAIESYESAVEPLWSAYASAIASIPRVPAGMYDNNTTDTRFYRAEKATHAALDSLDGVHVPDGATQAQDQARDVFAHGNSVALTGQNMSLDAEACLLKCTYGSRNSFPGYQRAMATLGSAASAEAAWKETVDAALERTTGAPKPVV